MHVAQRFEHLLETYRRPNGHRWTGQQRPKGLMPSSGVKEMANTGGPPYIAVGALAILCAAVIVARGVLRRSRHRFLTRVSGADWCVKILVGHPLSNGIGKFSSGLFLSAPVAVG